MFKTEAGCMVWKKIRKKKTKNTKVKDDSTCPTQNLGSACYFGVVCTNYGLSVQLMSHRQHKGGVCKFWAMCAMCKSKIRHFVSHSVLIITYRLWIGWCDTWKDETSCILFDIALSNGSMFLKERCAALNTKSLSKAHPTFSLYSDIINTSIRHDFQIYFLNSISITVDKGKSKVVNLSDGSLPQGNLKKWSRNPPP